MVVAVHNLVLIYDAKDGDLLHRLRGHKDTVYTVGFVRDGSRFASGGADKTVIIWTVEECYPFEPVMHTGLLSPCLPADFPCSARARAF